MNVGRNKGLLSYIGLVFLILGLMVVLYYVPQATQYSPIAICWIRFALYVWEFPSKSLV
jgi:uncharacterized membrane protein